IVVCFLFYYTGWAQENEITISGVVTDAETNLPVPGANILEIGTSNGTSTDFDGKFSLTIKENSEIEISSLGYNKEKLAVSGESEINVQLKTAQNELDEVIVTGYTNQVKRKLTSAVSNVSRDELQDVTSSDVGGMLQGKAAGVDVINTGGEPGSKPTINIRGISSLNGNTSPLWVVDGAIVHEAPDLNPNEVEAITVLKDASATALYGSRG